MIDIKYFKSSRWLHIIWPYLGLLLLHLIFVDQVQQPWLWLDEFIQLGHARYFSGGEHFVLLVGHPYANFGYAFLLLPAFWLFSEPILIYKAIVVINAIFASALYFPIYYILKQYFQLDKKIITTIALMVCFYPAFIAQTIIAWQDAVIFTFQATSIALLLYFLKKPSYISSTLFASTVGFLYMMHARALPILIISIVFLLFLAIYKKKIRGKIIWSIIIMLAFLFVTKSINRYMLEIAWQGGSSTYIIEDMLGRLTSLEGIKIFLYRALGQLLYLIEASYGLFIFGLAYLIQYIWQNKKNSLQETLKDEKVLSFIYLLLTSLGVFFASALFFATPAPARADQLIYGRYNELFLSLFLALGLVSFYFKSNNKWHYLIITAFIFSVSFLIHQEYLLGHGNGSPAPNGVPGLALWIFLFYSLKILAISALVLTCFLILIKSFAKGFFYGIFVLFILFSMNILVYHSAYGNLNDSYLPANDLLLDLKNLELDEAYYVTGNFCKNIHPEISKFFIDYNRYNYNWHIPNTKLHFFDGQIEGSLKHEYIVASACWVPPEGVRVELIKKDNLGMQVIWKIIK